MRIQITRIQAYLSFCISYFCSILLVQMDNYVDDVNTCTNEEEFSIFVTISEDEDTDDEDSSKYVQNYGVPGKYY